MTTVRIAQTEEAAQFSDGEPGSADPEFENLAAPSPDLPTFVDANGALDQIMDFSEEQLDYDCEWSCGGSSAVAEAVEKCQASQASPAARADCARTVCAKAERSPWAAVKAELQNSDACFENAAKVDGAFSCSIVYGNACTGLVGFVCSGHAGGKKETLSRVEEYRFQPTDASVR